jgi:membrane fusion protein (multidrug efflux system)
LEAKMSATPILRLLDIARLAVVPLTWVLALLLLVGCGKEDSKEAAAQPPPPAVGVVAVASKEVSSSFDFTGRIEAIDTVDLRARVEGFLEKRLFTEGTEVKKGQLLFQIEQGPYQAQVDEIKANIVKAQAALDFAQIQQKRYADLVKRQAVPQQRLDEVNNQLEQAKADLMNQQAALEQANLNLGYTQVIAPISGKIGRSIYSVGNLVQPSSGTLATIVSQDPIYATFPVSAKQLLMVQKNAAERKTGTPVFDIKLRLPDGDIYPLTGKVDFVGVQVDPSTDSVMVRATFDNPDRTLIDGMLVGIVVETAKTTASLLIPQAAILVDQVGPYVLVVDDQGKVEQRRIEVGQAEGTDTIVTKGLKAGEKVIVDGIQKVRPGMTVQASDAGKTGA